MDQNSRIIGIKPGKFVGVIKRFKPPSLHKIKRKEHLLSFLEKRKERKVFLFHGKAGQGKSVLAGDFLTYIKAPFLWYRLYKDDQDPVTFLNHMMEGIEYVFSLPERKSEDTITGNATAPLEERLRLIIDTLSKIAETHFFIVLDDFQNINSSETCCDVINLLIDNLPSHIHIVIISSTYPHLDFTGFRSEKELVELFDRDFGFSHEEVKELSREIYEINMDQNTLNRLMEISRGWITGITYLLEHLGKMSIDEQTEFLERFFQYKYLQSIDDFLREEVIEVLKPDIASLLIRTSLFDEITPEILYLFRGDEGAELFREIMASNTFLESGSDNSVSFTYFPLFSTFLERMFMELPESERNNAHLIAGNYYFRRSDIEKAIHHFFKSGHRSQGKEIFIGFADKLLDNGEYEATQRLLEYFTKQEIVQSPLLSYYDGLVMNLITPFSSRKNLLGLLPYFRKKKDYLREARIYTELLSNYLFYLESEESVNEITDMALEFLEYAGQALPAEKGEILNALVTLGNWWTDQNDNHPYEAALRAEETSFKFQNEEALLCSRLVLSKIYIHKGEFSDSLQLLLKTEKLFKKYPAKHPFLALIRFFLGDSYFYLGEIEKAIKETEVALESLHEGFAVTRFLKLNLIFYYLYTDEYEKAEAIFESERVKEIGENLYLQYFWVYLLQMLIAYRNENAPRAGYYCTRLMEKDNSYIMKQDYPFSYITISEINIYMENYDAAEEYLGIILDDKMDKENPYVYATVFSLLGYLHHLKGDLALAEQYFSRMEKILEEHRCRNLDICDPKLLQRIAKVSGCRMFESFPRLGVIEDDLQPTDKQEKHELEFQTLGVFRIFIRGKEIEQATLARQKRVIDLLMYILVFREHGISKEVVYETFWPRYSYKSARDNLNTVVYRLRKILGEGNDFIVTDMNIIKLKESAYTVDVDLFNRYIALGKAAESKKDLIAALNHYRKAQALYKGDFLKTEPYLDFIRDERENLKNTYKQLLITMTKLSLDTKQYIESLDWANKLISLDSLCEPAYRLLMIASVLTDNRSEITRIFNKLNTTLMENYNISPGVKTEKLKQTLLTQATPVPEFWRNETII